MGISTAKLEGNKTDVKAVKAVALRILIVEDDAIIGMLLVEMLVDMGHEVCGVERTAAGAVVAALSQRPDLMLVDAHLGAESGVAAVAQILRSRKVAYVLVSGGTIQSSKAEAVLLKKPFTSAELASALSRALALHRRDDVT